MEFDGGRPAASKQLRHRSEREGGTAVVMGGCVRTWEVEVGRDPVDELPENKAKLYILWTCKTPQMSVI